MAFCSFVLCWSALIYMFFVFFFKQKTAYEMRISDWSSDVCSSDLEWRRKREIAHRRQFHVAACGPAAAGDDPFGAQMQRIEVGDDRRHVGINTGFDDRRRMFEHQPWCACAGTKTQRRGLAERTPEAIRSEEHTSELQSLMRIP